MPKSKKPRKNTRSNKSSHARKEHSRGLPPGVTVSDLGTREIPAVAVEGMRQSFQRGQAGKTLRPGGVDGEVLCSARCPDCGLVATMRDEGGMPTVRYTPFESSKVCHNGLKGKSKAIYCPTMKKAFQLAEREYFAGAGAARQT